MPRCSPEKTTKTIKNRASWTFGVRPKEKEPKEEEKGKGKDKGKGEGKGKKGRKGEGKKSDRPLGRISVQKLLKPFS